MIVGSRGDGIFLSDSIGIINTNSKTHTKISVAAAAKFGYWEIPSEDDEGYQLAVQYERKLERQS